ncbi:sulfatase family protein [Planctopirus hydrillae]|uniref:Sulfatase n=1 Tax=Planctopirus hydrillae TaxID=1841610 RepID=A0A1C3EU04_9PLAN|nr:sulfatase [Planctopirus hydrillae]ODA36782.1 sulfatase [Planctopirus hydrillae]
MNTLRYAFILSLGWLAFFALDVYISPAMAAEKSAPPNILFIFSDDLAYQAISAYGDERKLLETPHIDRVAKEGIRFDRCVVTNSICGPCRATILTGKYSHKNGFYNNSNSRFDSTQTTFPKLLKSQGYSTALIGKWHLISEPTGFDHWEILPGQGIYYNPPMIANGQKVQRQGYVTDIITDRSIDWLKNRDKSKPFLLMAQHKAPHREWSPALRHLGFNKDKPFAEPATLFDQHKDRAQAVVDHDMGIDRTFTRLDAKLVPPPGINSTQLEEWNKYYLPRNNAFEAAHLQGQDLVRWRYQRYMHDYLACVKAVDESVGRLLQTLDEEGLAENTLVVVSSDQGFYLGEHGWFDKRWIFEESLRTPLLARWPAAIPAGRTNGQIVALLDIAQTFLDVAQIEAPADMQGASLLPLLKGDTLADWRKSLYYRYYEYPSPHRVKPHYGVVTDRYKLVHYEGTGEGEWELLDRQVDPQEVKSFHNDPAYAQTMTELKDEIRRLQKVVDDQTPPPAKAYGNDRLEWSPFGPLK